MSEMWPSVATVSVKGGGDGGVAEELKKKHAFDDFMKCLLASRSVCVFLTFDLLESCLLCNCCVRQLG